MDREVEDGEQQNTGRDQLFARLVSTIKLIDWLIGVLQDTSICANLPGGITGSGVWG